MIHLALLYGGASSEHAVSCRSAGSILQHLDRKRFSIIPIGIAQSGKWYLQESLAHVQPSDVPEVLPLLTNSNTVLSLHPGQGISINGSPLKIDLVFNIVHGQTGEDGRIQGTLDLLNIPCTGAGVLGSALGMDKAMIKQVWIHNDLPVVPFLQASPYQIPDEESKLNFYTLATSLYSLPLFVKPANAGSSVGVSKIHSFEEFLKALELAFGVDSKVLVEPAISAREIEVAVLGNENPRAFTPGEILPQHEFYDYEAKYQDPNGAQFALPALLNQEELNQMKSLAIKAYQAADCRGLARVDFFVDKITGECMLNEINTLPGFTSISMFPMMVAKDGMSYTELLSVIVDLALENAKSLNHKI